MNASATSRVVDPESEVRMIDTERTPVLSRREFARRWLRGVALGVVGAIGVCLGPRSRVASDGVSCPRRTLCRECDRLTWCDLTPAQETRRTQLRT